MAESKILSLVQRFFQLKPGEALPQVAALFSVSPRSFSQSISQYTDYFEEDRISRYYDYDSMDTYSDISVALDVYAEEATQRSFEKKDKTVWVTSDDNEVVKFCEELFEDIDIENEIFGMARHLAKYGDLFIFPYVEPVEDEEGKQEAGKFKVKKLFYLHPSSVDVVADQNTGKVIGFNADSLQIISVGNTEGEKDPPASVTVREDTGFSPWDIVHFCIKGSVLNSDYGRSMIESARRDWQTLAMLETAIALWRINRSGSRIIYYIDVGDASPEQSQQIIKEWIDIYKGQRFLDIEDPAAGNRNAGNLNQYLQKVNPYGMNNDIWFPVPRESNSKVENFTFDPNIHAIEDLEFFRGKMRTALGIPKAYFDQDISGWNANKALAQQDIRFSKKVERLQRALINGLQLLCAINLFYRGVEEFSFTVMMESPSSLELLQRLEVMQSKATIATELIGMAPTFGFNTETWIDYILTTVMQFSKDQIKEFQKGAEAPLPVLSPNNLPIDEPVGSMDYTTGGEMTGDTRLQPQQKVGGSAATQNKDVSDTFSSKSITERFKSIKKSVKIDQKAKLDPYRNTDFGRRNPNRETDK